MHNTSVPNISPRAPQIALLFEPLKLYQAKKNVISSQVESFYTPDRCCWLSKNSDEITSIGHVPYIMFLLNDYLSTNFISKHFLLERYVYAWTLWYFTVTFIVNDVSVQECHQNVSSVCVKNEMKLFSIMCKKQTNKPKNLSMLEPLMIKRLLWKPEATVWYSHGSCIDAEFGQVSPGCVLLDSKA